ncbi:MAG: PTS sugar transporter subunit IIA [Novosphingobium sp.]|uniref:PTS sugar transporter subunit IIA n=1 Tax=Tsuneonella sp. CC-YZS046 TaxID=3042152 RepID=UPI002D799A9B|nr:PTS sugar transporter subunit IIA [Tsuneonella sp. CC-YZS046]WRO65974.1 PTS sugar transporter subunit IIA [Tsuneonella sp. CC-YZS046]
MDFIYSLHPKAVAVIHADSKQAILEQLSSRFAQVYELDQADVLERIEEREKLGSTGFGRGVAIPHARVPGLARPVAAFLRLDHPVEFDSADGMPVEMVFGLLSPENAGAVHLQALAAVSRLFRNESVRDVLIHANDAEAIYALLNNVTDRDAA